MILTTKLDLKYEELANVFAEFLCKELSVTPRELHIVGTDLDEGLGQCIDVDEGSYLILVKESGRRLEQIFITIAHEMVHVKQYMTQELGRLLDEQSHVPYEDRWWEKEAYEKAVPLVEKFSETLTFFSKTP